MAKRRNGRRSITRRGTITTDLLKSGAAGAAGYLAASAIVSRAPASMQSGFARPLLKAGVGVIGAMALRRVVGRGVAASFGAGAVSNAVVELFQTHAAPAGGNASNGAAVHGYVNSDPSLFLEGDNYDAGAVAGFVNMASAA